MAGRNRGLLVALLCGCMMALAQATVLPTDLEAKVGASYEPADADERALWQGLARLEKGILNSPQRLIAPELDTYIRGVVERLLDRPAPDLRIYLMRDATPNAAMLPSGMMIVNTGLLARVRSEAQLAAVLAHEAGHYFRRHSLDLLRDNRRNSAMASSMASQISSYGESEIGWKQIDQVIAMSRTRFSRDLESEADAYGLMLMARAGYRPRAAFEMWEQLSDERRASAAARNKRYSDATNSELSTHPPTKGRMTDLADTADLLAAKGGVKGSDRRDEWTAVIQPYQALLLQELIYLNDPGASLYLLESEAKNGWTGLLRFNEGEVYRLRNAKGDDAKAASAYAAATTQADVPPEAWRSHGYALLKSGNKAEAHEALNRYLAMKPEAPDAAMIRFTMTPKVTTEKTSAIGGPLTLNPDPHWKKLPGSESETRWEQVWTWNGPQFDRMAVIGGLPDGKAIVFHERGADQQVPPFRADMGALDLTSMLEVSYRLRGITVFDIESVEPVDFLGGAGVRVRYHYASGIVIPKKGDCVMRVIDQKFYAMKLESLADRFDEVAPEFDQLAMSARLSMQ